jgi:conjugative relaxase-like TrwC/TraI family protein
MKQGPDYYLQLARGDYYLKGGEPLGEWFGGATTDPRINLSGTVKAKPLKNLLRRYSPDGNTQLSQIQEHRGKENRQGYDLTFSSSKSFSTLWSQADRAERELLQHIHAVAVRQALSYLEENACYVRRGKAGTELEKAKAIIAVFAHGASRARDPNYHTHCLWMHTAIGESGRTGTIDSRIIFQYKMSAGAIFRASETQLLKEMFGLEIERDRSCYRIKGVPKELEVEFSKRSEQIKEKLREQGRSGAKAAAEATLKTRGGKKVHVPRKQLMSLWKETGLRLGWGPEEARQLFREGDKRRREQKEDHSNWERDVTGEALVKLTHQQSSFTKREVVRFLAEESQVKGIGATRVLELAEKTLARKDVVSLGGTQHEERFSTKELLSIEEKLMRRVSEMATGSVHRVREELLLDVISKRPKLSDEQQAALRHATKGERIALIEGDAGTGKTYLLDALREAYEQEGYTVLGAALAGVAADGLKAGANIKESKTVARLLMDLKPQPVTPSASHGKDFSSAHQMARYGELVHKPRTTITAKTLLVLDESAMIGTRQLSELIKSVYKAGGKVVMVGDSKQLQSIETGGAFKAIRDSIGSSRLSKVIRMREEWQRQAAKDFSEGNAAEGLKAYQDHGLLCVGVAVHGDSYDSDYVQTP